MIRQECYWGSAFQFSERMIGTRVSKVDTQTKTTFQCLKRRSAPASDFPGRGNSAFQYFESGDKCAFTEIFEEGARAL